jgi:hypothetical protein
VHFRDVERAGGNIYLKNAGTGCWHVAKLVLKRQVGAALGGRLKSAWEWAAVVGQAELFGWTAIDIRWLRDPPN